ncbi:protein of unknown function [Anaerovibrio lipolyticus DSM 3074]|uniref:DUF4325 domain-containing protein n=1 Tax=Anaerovibrio lipolyticus DSM 3074 TaxID=1120997 RepID=A0A1M6G4A9_9FIRM|nr:DUF4325 domain-containing protein [Anaerovibrio lipolyticus]SHJ04712.1 protein of unknown function [Anaerovibrio lipolyticus DSM 3074]
MSQQQNIHRDKNKIIITRMDHPACVSDFIRCIKDGINRGYTEFIIETKNIYSEDSNSLLVYPNACVPIAGIIDYYRENGFKFCFNFSEDEYLTQCDFTAPVAFLSGSNNINPFDKVFYYDNSCQVAEYTKRCIDSISQRIECESGVLDSLTWCINEVMDNVLTHSECNKGYVMGQLHDRSKHIAICIVDTGIGIYNSLKNTKHHPKKGIDAISLSLQEGVGDGQGQGNGLFGLYKIVKENRGRLSITSGNSSFMLYGDDTKKFERLPYIDNKRPGTVVDFQIDLGHEVSLSSVFLSIGGYDGFDIRLDDYMVQEDSDLLVYDIYENCSGTATRDAGRCLRKDIINIFTRRKQAIVLDFSGVATVSSSFIDELVAKLIIHYGLLRFNQIFAIRGMNETVSHLCERSVYMRISEEWGLLKQ